MPYGVSMGIVGIYEPIRALGKGLCLGKPVNINPEPKTILYLVLITTFVNHPSLEKDRTMITIQTVIDHPNYSHPDRIKIQADVIRVLEESGYSLPNSDHGTPRVFIYEVTAHQTRIHLNVPGAMFNTHISPYWFESTDTKLGELDRIWTATFTTEVSEGN